MTRLAILGATGAVGSTMLQVLEERDFPLDELRLLASERSAGAVRSYAGRELTGAHGPVALQRRQRGEVGERHRRVHPLVAQPAGESHDSQAEVMGERRGVQRRPAHAVQSSPGWLAELSTAPTALGTETCGRGRALGQRSCCSGSRKK